MVFSCKSRFGIACLLFFFCLPLHAQPYYGMSITYPLVTKEPKNLHGFQFMLTYDPQSIRWGDWLNLYFDGGFSHFWINNKPYYTTLNIYSIAPVVRIILEEREHVYPFIDFSIGAAYLNHTHFENRNLGIHFAFQDRLGFGLIFGTKRQLTLGLEAIHYSNAHLSRHNSGVTIPVMLDIAYRFQ